MSCNIAFLISAHTDAPQLKRLIEALPADADFFVHIDAKSDITPFTLLIKNWDFVICEFLHGVLSDFNFI